MHATPKPPGSFPWRETIERAIWTALETPIVVEVLDRLTALEATGTQLLASAGAGFLVSAVKTISVDRLVYLQAKRAARRA